MANCSSSGGSKGSGTANKAGGGGITAQEQQLLNNLGNNYDNYSLSFDKNVVSNIKSDIEDITNLVYPVTSVDN